jgi:prevent-host-death family protein
LTSAATRELAALDTMYTLMYNTLVAKSCSVASARAKLSEIVDEVEAGKEVEITRRGKKVAVVMSAARFARLRGDRVAFTTAFESFRQEHDLERDGVEPNWAAEVRDTDTGRRVRL